MDLAKIKETVMLSIESLGLESEALTAVKNEINTLTKAYNTNEAQMRIDFDNQIATEKQSIENLSSKLKELDGASPLPPFQWASVPIGMTSAADDCGHQRPYAWDFLSDGQGTSLATPYPLLAASPQQRPVP